MNQTNANPAHPTAWELHEETLLRHVNARVLERASDLAGLGRVNRRLLFADEVLADVRGAEDDYRSSVSYHAGRPVFHCTCGARGPCSHAVAVLLIYMRSPETFIEWDRISAALSALPGPEVADFAETLVRAEEVLDPLEAAADLSERSLAAALTGTSLVGCTLMLLRALAAPPGTESWNQGFALLKEFLVDEPATALQALAAALMAGVTASASRHLARWLHDNTGTVVPTEVPDRELVPLLDTLVGSFAADKELRGVLVYWFQNDVNANARRAELWRLQVLSHQAGTRSRLVGNHGNVSPGSLEGMTRCERGLTWLLVEFARLDDNVGESCRLLRERSSWFLTHVPRVTGEEAVWTATQLDRLGANDDALFVVREALAAVPTDRSGPGIVRRLRDEIADRLLVAGRANEALAFWLANFEEHPSWALYGRVREAQDDFTEFPADQLYRAALERSGPELALQIALDMHREALVLDALSQYEVDVALASSRRVQLLYQAAQFAGGKNPHRALPLLQTKLLQFLKENGLSEEIEHDIVRYAKLVRGLTLSTLGIEGWRVFTAAVQEQLEGVPNWFRLAQLWEGQ